MLIILSYLNIKKVVEVAGENKIEAIHPGYGFLSENYLFAKKVEGRGIIFIGPSWKSIKAMGNKNNAKEIISSANIPLVDGFLVDKEKPVENKNKVKEIGFPVIAKAAAGGGGKGMRIVYSEEEVEEAFLRASSEAKNSFGDERLFVEKYLVEPRHIEIQIIADNYGNVVSLGERECSIQRRNQKVIEEAPSSFLDETKKNEWIKKIN